MQILILGGYGSTGKAIARHVLRQTQHSVIIAGRHLARAEELAASLQDPRAVARRADACDAASLKEALQGVDILLVASPTTRYVEPVVKAALDARVDYLDVQLSAHKLDVLRSYASEINGRGLCFTTEAGFHPGLPSALVRYAASKLDVISAALTASYLNVGGSLPYTEAVDELTELFLNYKAQVFKNGHWTGPSTWDVRKFDFGPSIGTRACYSMFFEELGSLPEKLPGLTDAGFYVAGAGWLADTITMLVYLGLKIAPQRGLRPLGRAMWWAMTKLPGPPYRVILQVEAKGRKMGQHARLLARLEHQDGYEFTAIPVVAFLMQYDQVRSAGLHFMGHLCEPRRLVSDMQVMGIALSERVQ